MPSSLRLTPAELCGSREQQLILAREASRAPSVHNIQPGRLHFSGTDRFTLSADRRVSLPVADASAHDRGVSLGCLLEGVLMSLAHRGLGLETLGADQAPKLAENFEVIQSYRVVSLQGDSAGLEQRWELSARRLSYRGAFESSPAAAEKAKVLGSLLEKNEATLISDPLRIREIARWHDEATLHFLQSRAYLQELYSWMRFSKADPRYRQDGLNAEAMSLSAAEALIASWALKPGPFSFFNSLGLAQSLVSEKAQTLSAAGLLLFNSAADESLLVRGQRFYRVWLKVTEAGLAAVPMSSSIDHEATRLKLEPLARLEPGAKLINCLRVGLVPTGKAEALVRAGHARVSPETLLV